MPVKLERDLKRQASAKGLKGERKDAYVYGTLRKTGWKPSREKKMNENTKVIRLQKISSNLDRVINFDDDNDGILKKTAKYGAAGTAGVGGLYALGKMAPTTLGGQQLSGMGALRDLGVKLGQAGEGGLTSIGKNVSQGAGVLGNVLKQGAGKVFPWLHGLSSKQQRLVELNSALDGVIQLAIDINPKNKGKFTATEHRTGESAEELLHSSNPLTRKRANFAIQARKWHHRLDSKSSKIEFAGNPEDPTAGMFGGNDPGFLRKNIAENEPVSALQRLRLKIAGLRGMGLHS